MATESQINAKRANGIGDRDVQNLPLCLVSRFIANWEKELSDGRPKKSALVSRSYYVHGGTYGSADRLSQCPTEQREENYSRRSTKLRVLAAKNQSNRWTMCLAEQLKLYHCQSCMCSNRYSGSIGGSREDCHRGFNGPPHGIGWLFGE